MQEIWKDIKDYEGLYQVSNLGRVKSLKKTIIRNNNYKQTFKEKILKPGLAKNGYLTVMLFKNKKGKTHTIHSLVAKTFLNNGDGYRCVNHIDGNKTNNKVENLEFCTYSHNIKEAYRLGLKKAYWLYKKGKDNHSSKKVLQYDKNMNLIKTWDSLMDTQRIGKYNYRCVSNCCLDKQKQHKGYIWRYINE